MKQVILFTLLCFVGGCSFPTTNKLKKCVKDATPFGVNQVRLTLFQKKQFDDYMKSIAGIKNENGEIHLLFMLNPLEHHGIMQKRANNVVAYIRTIDTAIPIRRFSCKLNNIGYPYCSDVSVVSFAFKRRRSDGYSVGMERLRSGFSYAKYDLNLLEF